MKLLKSVYVDSKGNEWSIERIELTTEKGGTKVYFCCDKSGTRFDRKRDLLKFIKGLQL